MKKKIATIIMAIIVFLSGSILLTACGNSDDDNAQVVSISVELVNDGYEMTDDTIIFVYGDKVDLKYSDFKVTATLDNGKTKELAKKTADTDGYTYQSSIPQSYDKTPVNNYTIVFRYGDVDPITIKVKVTKADFSGTLNWNYTEPYAYDGEEKTVEIVDLPTGVTVEYTGVRTATNVGEYTCTAVFTCTNYSNYKEIPSKTLTWSISPAKVDVSSVAFVEKEYNGNEQSAEIELTTLPSNVEVESITGDTTATDVGEYSVVVTFSVIGEGAENYTVDPLTATWKIEKGTYVPTGNVAFSGESSFVYNGQERSVTIDYSNLDSNVRVVGTPTNLSATNAGEYEVAIVLEYAGNETNNYKLDAGTLTLNWEIEKAPLTISAKDHSITYGDELSYNGINEPVGFVNGETIDVLSGELQFECDYEQYDNVGSYDIEISGYTSDNYDITYEAGELSVVKKVLTITPNNVTIEYQSALEYNGTTITGFVGDDDESVLGGTPVFSCDYTINSSVGTYDISISGYTAENYEIQYGTGILTVTKLTIDVSGVRLEKTEFTYDREIQSVAVDESTLPSGVSVSNIIMDRNGREPKAVSEYTAVVSLVYVDSVNYEAIPDLYLVWKIVKADVDVSDYSIVTNTFEYNGQTQSLSFTTLPAGAELIVMSGNSGKDAGLYECSVTIACSDKSNYNDFTEVKTFNWRIAPKTLTITANNNSVEYGMEGANAGVSYSGFVTGEDESVLEGEITYTFVNYSAGSNVGNYTIRITGSNISADNYEITLVNGQLEVYAKVVDLSNYTGEWQSETTREYNASTPFKPVLIDLPEGVMAEYTYTINDGTNQVVDEPIGINSYIATAKLFALNSNYTITGYSGVEGIDFEIVKCKINASSLVWTVGNNAEIEYSGNNLKPTYANSVSGLSVLYTYYQENSIGEYVVLDVDATIVDVGNYKVEATLDYDENYYEMVSAPALSEITFSIVKISVVPTVLTWNISTILESQEDNAIYYIADYAYTGVSKTVYLSNNTYLTIEYLVDNEYTTTAPSILENGDYEFTARISIVDSYTDTHKLSTNEDYFYVYIDICVSRTIFTFLELGGVSYDVEELVGETIQVLLNSTITYSIKSTYAFMHWAYDESVGDNAWVEVENGYVFSGYNKAYTLYVIDRAINPTVDPYATDKGVIYQLEFYTYIVKQLIYGRDNATLDYPNGRGVSYELEPGEELFSFTMDSQTLALMDTYTFKYMIIDSTGEWRELVDVDSMPMTFTNLEEIHCIMLCVCFDGEMSYQVSQFTIVQPTHISSFNVAYIHFYDEESVVDNCIIGSSAYSICNGIITGFEVVLKTEYSDANYSVAYYSDKEHTTLMDYTVIGEYFCVYYVISDESNNAVESGEFLFCHAFVPDNYPLCMNAANPNDDTPEEHTLTVNTEQFELHYSIVEDNGITIEQTYNGETSLTLQEGTQLVNYILYITYDNVTYTFEMPITVTYVPTDVTE